MIIDSGFKPALFSTALDKILLFFLYMGCRFQRNQFGFLWYHFNKRQYNLKNLIFIRVIQKRVRKIALVISISNFLKEVSRVYGYDCHKCFQWDHKARGLMSPYRFISISCKSVGLSSCQPIDMSDYRYPPGKKNPR